MEVSQEQLIDLGLNIVGFLAAGGLLMIVSSVMRGRKQRKLATAESPGVAAREAAPTDTTSDKDNPDIEFVSLVPKDPVEKDGSPGGVQPAQAGPIARRNRSEIIKMAKEMLEARRSTEEITESLPVSEAELALLSHNRDASHGENNG